MKHSHHHVVPDKQHSACLASAWCAVLAIVLASCSAGSGIQRDVEGARQNGPAPAHSIVFVIHGDGEYLYHDTSGNAYNADEVALAEAQRVAVSNPDAEVFIFHQKAAGRVLFVFPVRDGECYYYRNGRLIAEESYWRDQEDSRLGPETELYRRFHADSDGGGVRMFLYYGHEIPEEGGAGYDASYPERLFNVHSFGAGLEGFADGSGKLDLLVLSTCYGGTPYTIANLGPFARYILASPGNLHLSYLDPGTLSRLEPGLRDEDIPVLARRFSYQAFRLLVGEVQTAVTVAVFDVERVQAFLQSVRNIYAPALTALHANTQAAMAAGGRCDCAEIPAFSIPTIREGVEVLYRPPLFGRTSQKQSHSGWECRRDPPAIIRPPGKEKTTTETQRHGGH
jgi:hypothetical protein